jgi:DNA invertase Pin-like site-specific DNA recombinase
MTNYIAYYRVSTKMQGESKLGLQAQQRDVKRFTQNCDNCLLAEYTEVESGGKNNRPQLFKAIAHAKRTNSRLIIAKLDRLSRNAGFIFNLKDSGVDFVAVDIPEANALTIGIMAVLAEDERKRISERTRKAMQELKARGVKLGTSENFNRSEVRDKAIKTRRENAANNTNTIRARKYIKQLMDIYKANGQRLTMKIIVSELNTMGLKTARGKSYTIPNLQRLLTSIKQTA